MLISLTSPPHLSQLKSQLLSLVIQNQTLNESLGSVSDAVVGLIPSQLESLSAQAVRRSMGVLQQVPGWTRSQVIILVDKYMGTNQVNWLLVTHELIITPFPNRGANNSPQIYSHMLVKHHVFLTKTLIYSIEKVCTKHVFIMFYNNNI